MIRILVILLTLSGCVVQSLVKQPIFVKKPVIERQSVYLAQTPFFPQQQFQGGPASLATLLVESGVDVEPEELISQVYLPEHAESLQVEMLAAGRQYQRVPYQIDSSIEALFDELYAGRPVLVMQNLDFENNPLWHYAVVIGYESEKDEMVLRSGTESDKRLSMDKFIQTWQRAENWAFILLDSDELPANPDFDRYFQSILSMEQVLDAEQMIVFYENVNRHYSEKMIVAFGLADAYSRVGRFLDAATQYKRILTKDPQHVAATNNLAVTLQKLSCGTQARQMAEKAVSLSQSSGQFVTESQHTLQTIIDQQKKQQAPAQCQFDMQI